MKISLDWLKEHVEIDMTPQTLSDGLTSLGLESNLKQHNLSFNKVILGKIISLHNHPDSDHLKVCSVNIGDKNPSQIVCGAPNVKKNIFVPVAKLGATLNNGDFRISKIENISHECHQ